MDKNKDRFFFYGALFSISLFSLILLLLYLSFSISKPVLYFTQTDNSFVSVSIDNIALDQPPSEALDRSSELKDDSESSENIEDILDSIDTEKIVYSKKTQADEKLKTPDSDFLKKIQTRRKIEHEDLQRKRRISSEDLNLQHSQFKSKEKASSESGGEKNIYYAKVYALLYANWKPVDALFRQVKVSITILPDGTMRYKIKQVSGDQQFDLSVQAHLEYLLDTIFPIPIDGKSKVFDVYFKTKVTNE